MHDFQELIVFTSRFHTEARTMCARACMLIRIAMVRIAFTCVNACRAYHVDIDVASRTSERARLHAAAHADFRCSSCKPTN